MESKRVALVTGAGSGIGRASALALASTGWDLVLVGRTEASLTVTAQKMPAQSRVAICDVSDPQATRNLADALRSESTSLQALVNCAATTAPATLVTITSDTAETLWRTNVAGPMMLTQACLPLLAATDERRAATASVASPHSSTGSAAPQPSPTPAAATTSDVASPRGATIVSEGLAMLFEEQVLGRASEFAQVDITGHDIARAVEHLDQDPADDGLWFFHTGNVPLWFGYTLGYRWARDHAHRTGRSAADLAHTLATTIAGGTV